MSLRDKVLRLKVGRSFTVTSESARKEVLKIASILGWNITSKAKKGGFSVTRMP